MKRTLENSWGSGYHRRMPRLELQRPLSVPAVPARSAASSIMHAIQDGRDGWEDFALYLDFGSLGLPDVGYVAIPVQIEHVNELLEPRHEISFKLHARRIPQAFPVFQGGIGIDANGPSSSQIWFAGDYQLPMESLGAFVDKTFAHGAAERTLGNMLGELTDAIESAVYHRERAAARYRLVFNTGD